MDLCSLLVTASQFICSSKSIHCYCAQKILIKLPIHKIIQVFAHYKGTTAHDKGTTAHDKGTTAHDKGATAHDKGTTVHDKVPLHLIKYNCT